MEMTIIDKFLSKQANDQMVAAQTSLDSMLATVEKMAKTMSEKGFTFDTAQSEKAKKLLQDLAKAESDLMKQREKNKILAERLAEGKVKNIKLTTEEKVVNQDAANMERLKVRATNENINALSRLRAGYELATRALANHISYGF